MSNPFEYLTRAHDCLLKAVHAPNQDLRQDWLNAAENWLRMVPQELRTPTAERDQSTQQVTSKTLH